MKFLSNFCFHFLWVGLVWQVASQAQTTRKQTIEFTRPRLIYADPYFCFNDANGVFCWTYKDKGFEVREVPFSGPAVKLSRLVDKEKSYICALLEQKETACWDFESPETFKPAMTNLWGNPISGSIEFEKSRYKNLSIQNRRVVGERYLSKYGTTLPNSASNPLPLPYFKARPLAKSAQLLVSEADNAVCAYDNEAETPFVRCENNDGLIFEKFFKAERIEEIFSAADALCLVTSEGKLQCLGKAEPLKGRELLLPPKLSLGNDFSLTALARLVYVPVPTMLTLVPLRDKLFLERVLKHFAQNDNPANLDSESPEVYRRIFSSMALLPYVLTLDSDRAQPALKQFLKALDALTSALKVKSLAELKSSRVNRRELERSAAELLALVCQALRPEYNRPEDLAALDGVLERLPQALDKGLGDDILKSTLVADTTLKLMLKNTDNDGLARLGHDIVNFLNNIEDTQENTPLANGRIAPAN